MPNDDPYIMLLQRLEKAAAEQTAEIRSLRVEHDKRLRVLERFVWVLTGLAGIRVVDFLVGFAHTTIQKGGF